MPTFWSSIAEHLQIARTLRGLEIHFDIERGAGDWYCYQVCPLGCWSRDREQRVAILGAAERCVACGACVLQCPHDAIELR